MRNTEKQKRIISMLQDAKNIKLFGRPAAVARELGVSRQYVHQVIAKAGGTEALKLPNWSALAVELLENKQPISLVQQATGLSESHLRFLQRTYHLRFCGGCGVRLTEARFWFCLECRTKKAKIRGEKVK